jgi:protein involved in polysaccharide export with SLBB domain
MRGNVSMSGLIKRLLFAGLWLLSLFAFAQQRGEVDRLLSTYKLGAGDVVSIRVLGEDDLKREKIRLSDAGTISFPIIGEIRVLGKRVVELETLIADGLRGKYLLNPVVSVTIEEYRPIFVNGQVEKSGAYPFQPGLTIRKAVSLAGGFKERASKEKIFVIREDDKSQTPVKVDQSALVYPGDIITVEESFF